MCRTYKLGDQRLTTHTGCRTLAEPDNRDYQLVGRSLAESLGGTPGRHPSIADFAASAFGALCGGFAIALFWRRLSV
jgi:hypothetical protein